MENLEVALIIAVGTWIIARLEMICRTQRKHLKLERKAHPQLYKEIFGGDLE